MPNSDTFTALLCAGKAVQGFRFGSECDACHATLCEGKAPFCVLFAMRSSLSTQSLKVSSDLTLQGRLFGGPAVQRVYGSSQCFVDLRGLDPLTDHIKSNRVLERREYKQTA